LGVARGAGIGEAGHRVAGVGVADGGGGERVAQHARRIATCFKEFQILRRLAFRIPAARELRQVLVKLKGLVVRSEVRVVWYRVPE
jgi:hypothetical protein